MIKEKALEHCTKELDFTPLSDFHKAIALKLAEEAIEFVDNYYRTQANFILVPEALKEEMVKHNSQLFKLSELDDTIIMQYLSDEIGPEDIGELTQAAEAISIDQKGKQVILMPMTVKVVRAKLQELDS